MATSTQSPQTRNPLPIVSPLPLSARQEQEVRTMYQKRVKAKCANEIRDFAACALNHTFAVNFSCNPQKLKMNSCMMQHATQEEQDRAREEWFATRDLRKKERAEEQEKLKEKKKFHREWWGLDEHGRRIPGKGPEPDSGGATKSG